jgi:hypothetical protein
MFAALFIRNSNSLAPQSIPVIFFSNGQLTALTTIPQLTILNQCPNSTANLQLVQLSIIQPENPSFANNHGFAVVEISSNPNSFDESYIIGVNYFKNGGQVKAYNNITFPYNDSITTLSIRYRAENAVAPISLEVTYVNNDNDNPIFIGEYDPTVFNTIAPPSQPTYFGQQIKLDYVASVQNSEYTYFYFSLCEKDIFIGSDTYYTVSIQVVADLSTNLAAFNVVGCSARDVPNYINDCTTENSGNTAVIIDVNPASIAGITMDSRYQYLSEGIYVGIFGYGGELDGGNAFLLGVEEEGF